MIEGDRPKDSKKLTNSEIDLLKSQLREKLEPVMVDPSLLVVEEYFSEWMDYDEKVYIPETFAELLQEEKNEEVMDYYAGGRKSDILSIEETKQFLDKENVKTFSISEEKLKELEEEYSELNIDYEKIDKLGIRGSIFKEEIGFLLSHSALLSRLKKIYGKLTDIINIPLLSASDIPDPWGRRIQYLKNRAPYGAFFFELASIDVQELLSNLTGSPEISTLFLLIEGSRLFVFDP